MTREDIEVGMLLRTTHDTTGEFVVYEVIEKLHHTYDAVRLLVIESTNVHYEAGETVVGGLGVIVNGLNGNSKRRWKWEVYKGKDIVDPTFGVFG